MKSECATILEQSDDWRRLFSRLVRLEQKYETISRKRKEFGLKSLPLTIKSGLYKIKIKSANSFRAYQGRKRLFRLDLCQKSAENMRYYVSHVNQECLTMIPDIEPIMAQAVLDADQELIDEENAYKDWLSGVAEVTGLKDRNEAKWITEVNSDEDV